MDKHDKAAFYKIRLFIYEIPVEDCVEWFVAFLHAPFQHSANLVPPIFEFDVSQEVRRRSQGRTMQAWDPKNGVRKSITTNHHKYKIILRVTL